MRQTRKHWRDVARVTVEAESHRQKHVERHIAHTEIVACHICGETIKHGEVYLVDDQFVSHPAHNGKCVRVNMLVRSSATT